MDYKMIFFRQNMAIIFSIIFLLFMELFSFILSRVLKDILIAYVLSRELVVNFINQGA
jgi:hypothetical protein